MIKCKPNGESDVNLNQIMEELNKGNKGAIFKNYISYLEECEKNNKCFMSNLNGPEGQGDMMNHDYHHNAADMNGYQNVQHMNLQKRKTHKSKSKTKPQAISDLGNSEDDFEAPQRKAKKLIYYNILIR